ncbi:MAG: tRNA (adenosine(37)-N6)-threonylcarbamoyltransferase complex transferase subunit TsaD [Tepidiformaceae bacterium]
MRVLAIESSCDETAAAVVVDGRVARSSVVASQVELHARYGGVVPEVASRQHLRTIVPVIARALTEAGCTLDDIEAVAATRGPGLAGSLLVGYNAGKALAYGRSLPFLGVNHLEGHIYANWLVEGPEPEFPALCLVVSGGHTDLVFMRAHGQYERLGGTRDDAAGEAFDKVGRLLGLPFPGGPHIAREADAAARAGIASKLKLPRAWMHGTYDFSFSGLKTAALHVVQSGRYGVGEVAHAFQEAVVDVLAGKTSRLARELGAREVLVAGGVAANTRLREELRRRCPVPVRIPPAKFCTDNAAMIGAAAGYRFALGERSPLDEDIFTTNDWARVKAPAAGLAAAAAP